MARYPCCIGSFSCTAWEQDWHVYFKWSIAIWQWSVNTSVWWYKTNLPRWLCGLSVCLGTNTLFYLFTPNFYSIKFDFGDFPPEVSKLFLACKVQACVVPQQLWDNLHFMSSDVKISDGSSVKTFVWDVARQCCGPSPSSNGKPWSGF